MVFGMDGNYTKIPNDIHKIVKSVYELSILIYLLRCCDSHNKCFPSYDKITQGLMTRRHCMNLCKELTKRGYIRIKERKFKSNIFTINIERIVNDIHQCTTVTSEPKSPRKSKYTKNQLDIMAEKRATKNVKIAHRAEFKNGFKVTKGKKVINNIVTDK